MLAQATYQILGYKACWQDFSSKYENMKPVDSIKKVAGTVAKLEGKSHCQNVFQFTSYSNNNKKKSWVEKNTIENRPPPENLTDWKLWGHHCVQQTHHRCSADTCWKNDFRACPVKHCCLFNFWISSTFSWFCIWEILLLLICEVNCLSCVFLWILAICKRTKIIPNTNYRLQKRQHSAVL